MAWGKKTFMELDGKIKPHSLTNGSSKQTVGSNENFSFYIWQMKNVHQALQKLSIIMYRYF